MNAGDTSKMAQPTGTPQPSGVKIQHQRAPSFRSVYAHGAWGAYQARNITLAFFNERPPLPESVTYEVGPTGQFAQKEPAIKPSTDAQVMRQFEVEVFMSLETARVVHAVLGNFIKLAEQDKSAASAK